MMNKKENEVIRLYLDVLKKALSYSLWKEPGIPVETFNYKHSWALRQLVSMLSHALAFFSYQLVKMVPQDEQKKQQGIIWPMQADTMIGMDRLDNVQRCVETVLHDEVAGDFIETGVWRGGTCILMRAILAAHGVNDRRVFVADSFRGLPQADTVTYPQDRGDKHHRESFLAVSRENVECNFRKYGLLDDQVVFLEGWFKDTLPSAPIDKLAVMRLDGDMYGSTMDALVNLYPKLSAGGYCIVDDYALKGCRDAVNDFRAQEKISDPIVKIDWTGVYWRKG